MRRNAEEVYKRSRKERESITSGRFLMPDSIDSVGDQTSKATWTDLLTDPVLNKYCVGKPKNTIEGCNQGNYRQSHR